MNPTVKLILYIVLTLGVLGCMAGFVSKYRMVTDVPPEDPLPLTEEPREVAKRQGTGAMMTYGALGLLLVVGLGLLIAYDVSRALASRAEKLIFSDDGEASRDPDYEEAETLWANGEYLDAIQQMREHLKRHPHHQYVALRIAEIYEKDLNNPLAAALEYEQILEKKLPAERWGWSAIHLANLYSGKLGKVEQAEELLRRVVRDFGQTAAARKARERLGEQEAKPQAPPPRREADAAPSSHLPPGFRPKKG